MSQIDIWCGLEHEVRAAGNVRLFNEAQERHPALRRYATVCDAIAEATPKNEDRRQAIVAALLAEYNARPARVWGAALALAVKPMLLGLMKKVGRAVGDDADATIFAEFLEAATRVRSTRRVVLRLYSETRRRVLRGVRVEKEMGELLEEGDVDEIAVEALQSVESMVDQARFMRSALAVAPIQKESVARYVGRVCPAAPPSERRRIRGSFNNLRAEAFVALRDQVHAVV